MTSSRNIESYYKNNQWCRQHCLCPDGNIVANLPPLEVATTDQATLDAAVAKNDALKAAAEAVEAHEAALRVNQPDESVPATVTQDDGNGGTVEVAHPLHKAYDDAQALISAATAQTTNLVLLRKGIPSATIGEGDEEVVNPDYTANQAAWNTLNAELN